jgi:hypothetical protein
MFTIFKPCVEFLSSGKAVEIDSAELAFVGYSYQPSTEICRGTVQLLSKFAQSYLTCIEIQSP